MLHLSELSTGAITYNNCYGWAHSKLQMKMSIAVMLHLAATSDIVNVPASLKPSDSPAWEKVSIRPTISEDLK